MLRDLRRRTFRAIFRRESNVNEDQAPRSWRVRPRDVTCHARLPGHSAGSIHEQKCSWAARCRRNLHDLSTMRKCRTGPQRWWQALPRLQMRRMLLRLREEYVSNAEAWLGPSPPGLGAQMRKKVTQITEDAALPPVYPQQPRHSLGRRGYGHDLDSDSTGVLLYAVLGAFLMLSSIYAPA